MIALIKLSPMLVLGGLMLSGMDILLSAPIACVYAVLVGMIVDRYSFDTLLDSAVENLQRLLLVFLILQAAYAVAECFMATGVAASIINMAISVGLSAKYVAVVALIVTAVLSVATGTSWGTFAACAPIFLWLNHIVGGSAALTVAAIAGGSCFGDNLGLISDTTVVSSGIQEVSVIDRIRHQGVWSLLCLTFSAFVFYGVAVSLGLQDVSGDANEAIRQIPEAIWTTLAEKRPAAITLLKQVQSGVPFYMVTPLVLVLGLAAMGFNTLICLGVGIFSSYFFGLAAGTVESGTQFLDLVMSGFSSAGNWCIVMMLWVGAFGGIMRRMNAFDPISKAVLKVVRSVRQLMFANATLCLLGNAALADEMAQIVTISPIIKTMTEKSVSGSEKDLYTLALRNATFADAMAVFGSQLIPWHVYMAYFISITYTVYPMAESTISIGDVILHNYMAWIAVVSMLVLTYTGLDRLIPMFRMPSEPDVQLRVQAEPEGNSVPAA